jgi:hypothetical protein
METTNGPTGRVPVWTDADEGVYTRSIVQEVGAGDAGGRDAGQSVLETVNSSALGTREPRGTELEASKLITVTGVGGLGTPTIWDAKAILRGLTSRTSMVIV